MDGVAPNNYWKEMENALFGHGISELLWVKESKSSMLLRAPALRKTEFESTAWSQGKNLIASHPCLEKGKVWVHNETFLFAASRLHPKDGVWVFPYLSSFAFAVEEKLMIWYGCLLS